jgi:hypothetical protein
METYLFTSSKNQVAMKRRTKNAQKTPNNFPVTVGDGSKIMNEAQ